MKNDPDCDPCNSLPPFNPNDPESDACWLPLCSPQDRLTYMTAKGVYDTAHSTAEEAIAKAKLTRDQANEKASAAFDSAMAAALAAGQVLDTNVAAANGTKDAISATFDLDKSKVRADPSQITLQVNAVKTAVANYTAASAAVVTAQAPFAAAITALAKLATSVNPVDPGRAFQSADAANIAEANNEIAKATAMATLDKAENVFNGVRFQLWTKLNDQD